MTRAIWMNAAMTVGNLISDGEGGEFAVVMEPGVPGWDEFVLRDDIEAFDGPTEEQIAAAELAARRAAMSCSPLQGRLILGETICAQLDAMADDPATPWATREALKRAQVWNRTSPLMEQLAAAWGYSPEDMDDLFTAAAQISV